MNRIKKLITGAVLLVGIAVATFITPQAQAGLGDPAVVVNSDNFATKNITNSTTIYSTNYYTLEDTAKDVALFINFKLNGAGTSNLVVNIDKGLGTGASDKWSTNFATLLIPANGTTEVNWGTNYTVGAMSSFRFRTTANVDSTSLVTNLTIRASSK